MKQTKKTVLLITAYLLLKSIKRCFYEGQDLNDNIKKFLLFTWMTICFSNENGKNEKMLVLLDLSFR